MKIEVSGENEVSALNYLNGRTTKTIKATFTSTSISNLIDLEGNNDYTITLTENSVNAGELKTVDAATTIAVNADSVATLTGTYADIIDVYSHISADTIDHSNDGGDFALTLSESITVGQANNLSAKTTGVVTATISNMTMSELALLDTHQTTNSEHAFTITIADTSVNAGELETLHKKTSVAIDIEAVTTLTGDFTEVKQFYTDVNHFTNEKKITKVTLDAGAIGYGGIEDFLR